MKIVHLSTADSRGGAAKAAYRLHRALRERGYDSTMFVAQRETRDASVVRAAPSAGVAGRLSSIVRAEYARRRFEAYRRTRPATAEAFSDDRSPYGAAIVRQLPPCDVINLHWIAGFVDYASFFPAVTKPMVWRLSDQNPFTGGCHYDQGCGKHRSGCGACPQLGSSRDRDLSYETWRRKARIFDSLAPSRLHIVAQSSWMADEVRRSTMLGKFPVTVIPNGVDTAVFAPRSRRCARESLGIPEDARVVLFSAASVTSIRKGFAFLSSALEGLEIPALLLLSIGKGNPEVPKRIAHMHLGRISDERLLAAAYNAADVFAIPSLQDTLPNTVLEAMACGIPVVGFAVGGIKDQVESGLTGRLVPAGDAGALRDAITCLLHDGAARDQASRACRAAVLEKYELGTQVRRFVEVYQGMMEGGSVRASSAAAETLDGAEAPAAAFEIGR